MIKELSVKTSQREEVIDITKDVEKIVSFSKIKEGTCIVYCRHTTAAVTVDESYDETVGLDLIQKLKELVPQGQNYKHDARQGEGNADAHIKVALVGPSVSIPVQKGKPALGTWQGVMFCEFDGPRQRKVLVQLLSE